LRASRISDARAVTFGFRFSYWRNTLSIVGLSVSDVAADRGSVHIRSHRNGMRARRIAFEDKDMGVLIGE
jgi:hypothetical protein